MITSFPCDRRSYSVTGCSWVPGSVLLFLISYIIDLCLDLHVDLDHTLVDRILSEKLVFELAAAKQEPFQDQVESLVAPLFVEASL